MFYIKVGNMYVCYLNCDSIDNSIEIKFTTDIDYAKKYKPLEIKIFKDLVDSVLIVNSILEVIGESDEEKIF